MNKLLLLCCVFNGSFVFSQNQLPQVKVNHVDATENKVLVNFDLSDNDNDSLNISIRLLSLETSNLYTELFPVMLTGDIGFPVMPGKNKQIEIKLDPSNPIKHFNVQIKVSDDEELHVPSILEEVNQDSLKSYVQFLQGRRNSGDPLFYDKCRNYLFQKLNTQLSTKVLEVKTPQYLCKNFEATKYGTENPVEVSIIDAHYDSHSNAPGADDNASGVAGVLEAARILAPYASCSSLRFVLFDLEEAGLVGSLFYTATQLNPSEQIKNVINFEMIGYYTEQENTQDLPAGFNILFPDAYNKVITNNRKGDFITNVGNTTSTNLMNLFESQAATYLPQLKVISLNVPGNGTIAPDLRRSDHAVFWDQGIPALMITDGANFRNKNYHTIKDSIQYLNFEFMSQVVKASIASLIETACIEHAFVVDLPIKLSTALEENSALILSPHYYKNKIIIECSEELANSDCQLYNIAGQNFLNRTNLNLPKGVSELHCPELNPGIYLFAIKSDKYKNIIKLIVPYND